MMLKCDVHHSISILVSDLMKDDDDLPESGPIKLQLGDEIIRKTYESDAKCALWIFPYHCIQFKNVLRVSGEDISESTQLMEEIIKATKRPKYLRNLSEVVNLCHWYL